MLFDVDKAKVFEFKKDEKRWADKGIHPLKVLANKTTKQARCVSLSLVSCVLSIKRLALVVV